MKRLYIIVGTVVLLAAASLGVYTYRHSEKVENTLLITSQLTPEQAHTQESGDHALLMPSQAQTGTPPAKVVPPAATPPVRSQAIQDIEAGVFTKPSNAELRARLTALQYQVTQEQGTEAPFQNLYWHNEQTGLYVDIVSGEPLFSSRDKYDSGTGWPSFTKPIKPAVVEERVDTLLGETRTEIVSAIAKSHLGHVFDDGPPPTGKRYCMNSAALRFIPVADLATEGYGGYKYLFQ